MFTFLKDCIARRQKAVLSSGLLIPVFIGLLIFCLFSLVHTISVKNNLVLLLFLLYFIIFLVVLFKISGWVKEKPFMCHKIASKQTNEMQRENSICWGAMQFPRCFFYLFNVADQDVGKGRTGWKLDGSCSSKTVFGSIIC